MTDARERRQNNAGAEEEALTCTGDTDAPSHGAGGGAKAR